MAFRTLEDLAARGKLVLLRADLNVPMQDGRVTDAMRIERLLPIEEFGYIGRPARASVSEGYPQTHQLEQQRVLDDALAGREMTFA